MPHVNYWKDVIRAMATDDECALTQLPNEQHHVCPDCGLTPAHSMQLEGSTVVLGLGALLAIGFVAYSLMGTKSKRRRKRY